MTAVATEDDELFRLFRDVGDRGNHLFVAWCRSSVSGFSELVSEGTSNPVADAYTASLAMRHASGMASQSHGGPCASTAYKRGWDWALGVQVQWLEEYRERRLSFRIRRWFSRFFRRAVS